ncbi:MAG: hypothetical protein PHR35_02935 [Kiritimatiellae bacterium]|nr:hypothetical protein [Kiritimatiellia bacterium]
MALSSERSTNLPGGSVSSTPFGKPVAPPPPLPSPPPPPLPPQSPPPLPAKGPVAAGGAHDGKGTKKALMVLLLLALLGAAVVIALQRMHHHGTAGEATAARRSLWQRLVSFGDVVVGQKPVDKPRAAPVERTGMLNPKASLDRAQMVVSQVVARNTEATADWNGGVTGAPETEKWGEPVATPPEAASPAPDTAVQAPVSVPAPTIAAPPATAPVTPAETAAEPVVWPTLMLTAVAGSGAKGVAQINGEMLTVGEQTSDGVLLVRVEPQAALVKYGDATRLLQVKSPRAKTPPPPRKRKLWQR